MRKKELWRRRVEEWRSSGLASTQYCEGKSFTAGGLRCWAHLLDKERASPRQRVRLARVLRVPSPSPTITTAQDSSVIIKMGPATIELRPGFDPATLSAILDAFVARWGRA